MYINKVVYLSNLFHYQYFTTYCITLFWTFYHFTCLYISEGYIIRISDYDCDIYLIIASWRKSVGSCDEKLKENTRKKKREEILNCKF